MGRVGDALVWSTSETTLGLVPEFVPQSNKKHPGGSSGSRLASALDEMMSAPTHRREYARRATGAVADLEVSTIGKVWLNAIMLHSTLLRCGYVSTGAFGADRVPNPARRLPQGVTKFEHFGDFLARCRL